MLKLYYAELEPGEAEGNKGTVGEVIARQSGRTMLVRVTDTAKFIYAVRSGDTERKLNGPFPKNADIAVDISNLQAGEYTLYAGDMNEEIFAYGNVTIE